MEGLLFSPYPFSMNLNKMHFVIELQRICLFFGHLNVPIIDIFKAMKKHFNWLKR